jgi:hypothetical protein
VFGLVVVGLARPAGEPARAAAGINKTLNFQGRLLTATGAVVADGNYNIKFKIYQDGTGTTANNGGTGLKWTEEWINSNSQGITVKNGYFSVALGTYCAFDGSSCTGGQSQSNTAVDWNQDTLWLSMNVGGTTTGAVTYDGELLPMKRLASSVYALQAENANKLGGLTAAGFIQNTTTPQTNANFSIVSAGVGSVGGQIQAAASGTAAVLALENGSGSTGDLLQLQNSSATPLARFSSAGNLYVAGSVDTQTGTALAVGNANATSIAIGNTGSNITTTVNGLTVLKPASDSTTALQVQSATGSKVLVVDTTPLNSLINNPSIEGTDNTNWANKSGTGTPTRICTDAYIGSCSEQVVFGTGSTDAVKYTPASSFGAATYTLSFSLKQTAGDAINAAAKLDIGYNNGSDHDTACTPLPSFSAQNVPTAGWARYTCSFTTTGTSTYLYWKQVDTPSVARTILIDALQFEAASSGNPFHESALQLNGLVNSAVSLQNTGDSTTAFQVQNAVGTSAVLTADTLNGKAVFGSIVSGTVSSATQVLVQAAGGKRGLLVEGGDTSTDLADFYSSCAQNVAGFDKSGGLFVSGVASGGCAGGGTVSIGNTTTNVAGQLKVADANNHFATIDTVANLGGNITLNLPAVASGSNICTDGAVCTGYQASATAIIQVPTTTAQNTIAPTTPSVVGLTVKGTTGTAADVLDVYNSAGSPTLQDYFDSSGSLNVGQLIQPTSNNAIDLGKSGTGFRTGYFGTSVLAPTFDTPSGTSTLSLGITNASAITLGHSTSFSPGANRSFFVQQALSGSNGDQLTIQAGSGNGTSKNGGNLVLQGGNSTSGGTAGGVIVQPQTDVAAAFQVENTSGESLLGVDTTKSGNLVTNPSFEGNITGWSARTGCTTMDRNTSVTIPFGTAVLRCITSATSGSGVNYAVTLSASTTYDLSFYINPTSSMTNPNGLVFGYSYNGSDETTNVSASTALTANKWTRVTFSFTTPSTAPSGSYIFINQTDTTARTFYIDGVQLETGTAASAYKESRLTLNGAVTSSLLVQPATDTTTGFAVYTSSGAQLLTVDTTDNRVGIGSLNPAGKLQVQSSNSAIPTLLVQAASGQSVNILQLQDSNGNVVSSIDSTGGKLTLGRIAASGAVAGSLVLADGSNSNFGVTLNPATLTNNRTITLPDAGGTVCLQSATACGFELTTGTDFIKNQTSQQTSANFNIDGTGKLATLDSTGTSLSIGPSANTISLGKTSANTATTISGTALVQPTSGNDSATAFQVQNATGNSVLTVGTTGADLVTNGSLEAGTTGWAAKGGGTSVSNSGTGLYGTQSLDVTTGTGTSDGAKYNLTLTSGHQYSLSFYAQLHAINGSTTAGQIWSSFNFGYAQDGTTEDAGGLSSTGNSMQITTNGSWYRWTLTFTPSSVSGTPYLYFKQTSGTSREFYLDGVQLEDTTGFGSTSAFDPYTEGKIQFSGKVVTPLVIAAGDTSTALQVLDSAYGAAFTVDPRLGRVGIGTGSPGSKLQVSSGATNSVSTYSVIRGVSSTLDSTDGGSNTLNLLTVNNSASGFTSATDPFQVNNRGELTVLPYTLNAGAGAGESQRTSVSITGATGQAAGGAANTGSAGGVIALQGGTGGASTGSAANANGGAVTIKGGTSGSGGSGTAGTGGAVTITGGSGSGNGSGGNIVLSGGALAGSGGAGSVIVKPQASNDSATAFQVQNAAGTSNIFTVDTVGNQVALGKASNLTGQIQFYGSGGSGYVTLKGPTTPDAGNYTATLANCSAVGSAGGDLTGSYPSPTIAKLQGGTLTVTSVATGQVLNYNGSAWVNTGSPTLSSGLTVTAGPTSLTGSSGGSSTAATVATGAASNVGLKIQGSSSQTADLWQLQDSTGANVLRVDSAANQESNGYWNNGIGGIGQYANLLTYSEQLDNAAWSATNVTVTADDSGSNPAPDGQTSADKLVSSSSGTHTLAQACSSAACKVNNGTYTFSLWVKTNSGTQPVQLRIDSAGSTPTTGTAASYTATTTWQRFAVTQTFSGTPTSITPTFVISNNSATVVGWGAQVVNASNAQVYVRATASAVSASQGTVSNGGAFISSINATDIPLVVQGAPSQSGDLLQLQNSSGSAVLNVDASGNLNVAAADSYKIGGVIAVAASGSYLRINESNQFSNGVYLGTSALRVGGTSGVLVGSTGADGQIGLIPSGVDTTRRITLDGGTGNIQGGSVDAISGALGVGATTATTVNIGSVGSTSKGTAVHINDTSDATNTQAVTIGSAAGNTNDVTTIQGGSNTTAAIVLAPNAAGGIQIGGTSQTGQITVGQSTASNTISIGSGSPAASATQTVNIGNGSNGANASSAINVNILSGSAGSAGTGQLLLANNDRVTQVDVGNVVADAARTFNLFSSAATAVDTINIGTGNGTVAGAKTIHIGDGTPSGSGTNVITIGSNGATANTVTIQGGNGSGAVSIQSAASGTIGIATNNAANTVQIGNTANAVAQTINIGNNGTASSTNTVTVGSSVGSSATTINAGSGNVLVNATSGTVTLQTTTSGDINIKPAGSSNVVIGTSDTTGTLLVLDTKTGSGDPTGSNGGMYYNSNYHEFRCYRDSNWEPCGINPIDRGFEISDEFIGGDTSTCSQASNVRSGELGWHYYTITACNIINFHGGTPGITADHPGQLAVTTPASANQGNVVALSSSNGNSLILGSTYDMKTTAAIDSTASQLVLRVGLYPATSGTNAQPVSGVWFEADPATDSHWRYCTGNGTSASCTNSTVALGTAWTRFEIRITATGTGTSAATFIINGTSFNVSAVTIDTTNAVSPAFQCYATTANSRICSWDYFQLYGVASSAR